MKVLWLCNFMLPAVAEKLGQKGTNKEGWISGMAEVILRRQESNDVSLGIAFPVPAHMDGLREELEIYGNRLRCFGFYEDTAHPEQYQEALEERLAGILKEFGPDVVHCYGTEYPHTLAMCRVCPDKKKLLISIQGLCSVYANTYFADLPEREIGRVTFRDWLKKDSLVRQKEKYVSRGEMEIAALKLAGNVAGRTDWDRFYAGLWNSQAKYHLLNETLRSCFYEGSWQAEQAKAHRIFLSQGNYPIKGLHYMLLALPRIRERFLDVEVAVAGDSIIRYETWKDKIRISAYGRYLRRLIKKYDLEKQVIFLGPLTGEQMKEQYLKSGLFVCPSTIENSPNSLGEAMLLGMPCVSADVGGVSSIFTDGVDGVLYPGFRNPENLFDVQYLQERKHMEGECGSGQLTTLEKNAAALAEAVIALWEKPQEIPKYCENAKEHARRTHDREQNYRRMLEIYEDINRS